MKELTAQEFEVYRRVREYLKDAKVTALAGYLNDDDSLHNPGDGTVRIGASSVFDDPWDRYMEGYYDAADALIDEYSNELEAIWVVYPILFLYRHFTELMLKSLIGEAVATFKDQLPPTLTREHNVSTL